MSAFHLSTRAVARFALPDADLCVKCGLCLPHCPTYLEQGHEADSPRGRIALLQAQASGALALTPALEAHIDGCLACRACERVCPAQVPYGKLLDLGRANLAAARPSRTRRERALGVLLTRRMPRRMLRVLLRMYQHSGLQGLLRRTHLLGRGRLARWESLLPAPSPRVPLPAYAPARRETVQLFKGCAGELFDTQTLDACTALLRACGAQVEQPTAQGCCGALHQHAGEYDRARELAQANAHAFAGTAPVLFAASGCGAGLLDAPGLFGGEELRMLSARVRDVSDYLLEHWPALLPLAPLHARVAILTPCTQRNVIGGAGSVRALLEKIPGIELVDLDPAGHCCGAAGSQFITQRAQADQLVQRKVTEAAGLQPDWIVSSNIGCSLHLSAALRRAGITAPVVHPTQLLARQLLG